MREILLISLHQLQSPLSTDPVHVSPHFNCFNNTVTKAKIFPGQQNYHLDFNITFRIFYPHHLWGAVTTSSLLPGAPGTALSLISLV